MDDLKKTLDSITGEVELWTGYANICGYVGYDKVSERYYIDDGQGGLRHVYFKIESIFAINPDKSVIQLDK